MLVNYSTFYDDKYWTGRKTYQSLDGATHLYHGPGLAWEGFQLCVDALAPLVPGKSALDIGCGGGDLVQRLIPKGFDAYGVDVSEHAVKNCSPEMKYRLALTDITTCPEHLYPANTPEPAGPFPNKFDLILATDLLEHIFIEDLDRTFDWMVSKSNRWLFFCVAVTDSYKSEFVHKKGEPVPIQHQATAVSGHVNVRFWGWWGQYFRARKDITIRWDLMYIFQLTREKHKDWKATPGWDMGTTFVLEKK